MTSKNTSQWKSLKIIRHQKISFPINPTNISHTKCLAYKHLPIVFHNPMLRPEKNVHSFEPCLIFYQSPVRHRSPISAIDLFWFDFADSLQISRTTISQLNVVRAASLNFLTTSFYATKCMFKHFAALFCVDIFGIIAKFV